MKTSKTIAFHFQVFKCPFYAKIWPTALNHDLMMLEHTINNFRRQYHYLSPSLYIYTTEEPVSVTFVVFKFMYVCCSEHIHLSKDVCIRCDDSKCTNI